MDTIQSPNFISVVGQIVIILNPIGFWFWKNKFLVEEYCILLSINPVVPKAPFLYLLKRWVLSVFSPNTGKYRPEQLPIRTLFTQCARKKLFRCFVFSKNYVPLVCSYLFFFFQIWRVINKIEEKNVFNLS